MSRVLVVEDDAMLRRAVCATFAAEGFEVTEAVRGAEALAGVSERAPDLVVLDLHLPGIDGLTTLRHLRAFSTVPVLVLTVRDTLGDKVTALDLGADDYMVKPFEPEELLARARAHMRRTARAETPPATIVVGALEIDSARGLVTWEGRPVALTPTEFRVLDTLLEHRGRLVRHEDLIESVWGHHHRPGIDNVRGFVLRLRRKLHDDTARPRLIVSEPGLGYRLIDDPATLD